MNSKISYLIITLTILFFGQDVIVKHNELFSGFEQQDSQELFIFLMDRLHEDLNKITRRIPIAEQNNDNLSDKEAAKKAWNMHLELNKSKIVDLFHVIILILLNFFVT